MVNAAGFLAQFFPIFLLGAVFGKLMDDSGAVRSVAGFMAQCLGERRVILAVVLAGALVTYGGVSLCSSRSSSSFRWPSRCSARPRFRAG
ncbi:H+/gluconate symporter-like permease [Bradyrhizobium sp. LM6.11]